MAFGIGIHKPPYCLVQLTLIKPQNLPSMLTQTESDEGSSEMDNLLAELEKETLPEDSSIDKSEKIKDKQAEETIAKIKHTKPDWADKKDDDINTYDYSEKEVEDMDW